MRDACEPAAREKESRSLWWAKRRRAGACSPQSVGVAQGPDRRVDALCGSNPATGAVRTNDEGMQKHTHLARVLATWDICSSNWTFSASLNELSCQNTR